MVTIVNDYSINEKTILITGVYNPHGKLYSKILEEDKLIFVKLSPVQVINRTLLRLGSSFDGARHSSKALLGDIRMHPITISTSQGIWLFPSKSFEQPTCVWFSLTHIKGTQRTGLKKTLIHLSYNHTYEINMKEAFFNQKRQKAEYLREIIIKNTNTPLTLFMEPKKGLQVSDNEENPLWIKEDGEGVEG
ncbi:competence protein ComK [Bacillus sp. EB01]|uniref:competence protein ComK n=1 Tax=Bacillus sp. EB01 TaxID=1347086 RepID=UPI0005C56C59|nr:competence protein ComK [Bacillus sp. EB01]